MSTAKKARYILSATTTSWKKTRGFFLWVSLCSMCDVYIQLTVGDCIRFDFVGVPDYGMWGKNKHKTHTKHNEAAKKYDLIARNYSMDEQEKQKHTAQAEYTEEQRKNNRVFIHNLLFVFFFSSFFRSCSSPLTRPNVYPQALTLVRRARTLAIRSNSSASHRKNDKQNAVRIYFIFISQITWLWAGSCWRRRTTPTVRLLYTCVYIRYNIVGACSTTD